MTKMILILLAVLLVAASCLSAQSAFLRTEGGEDKKAAETFAVWDDTYEVWLQNFNTEVLTLRGGPLQNVNGYKLSECVAWTPSTGALAANVNTGHASVCEDSKTFWEVGAYAPLNDASCWSLVLYEARMLKRFDTTFAVGPVVYGKWLEGHDNDALAVGVGAEYRVEGGCFYGRIARNIVSNKSEFRFQYAFGF